MANEQADSMGGKRKRSRAGQIEESTKKLKLSREKNNDVVKDFLLSQYYHEVMTLREYLLSKLPLSSKVRRRTIASVGKTQQSAEYDQTRGEGVSANFMSKYLDGTLVGILEPSTRPKDERMKAWTSFSQLADKNDSGIGGSVDGGYCQSEVSYLSVASDRMLAIRRRSDNVE